MLFQRAPLLQWLFPEAKIIGGAAFGDTVALAVTTVVGLGAYDAVSGATSVVQVVPLANNASVPATTGANLIFTYKNTNTDNPGGYQSTSGTLPSGLTKGTTVQTGRTQSITGTPTAKGSFPITITAWESWNGTTGSGRSTSGSFTIFVLGFNTQPASTSINSGSTTTLTCAVTGAATGATVAYQWYQGSSGTTTTPVGTNSPSFTTPALSSTTSYWVKVTSTLSTAPVSVNSNTATVTVNSAVPAAISSSPASITINYQANTAFSVTASGTAPLTYQWYQGTAGVTTTPVGTNSSSYATPPLTSTTSYWVKVSNAANPSGANSATATATVRSAYDTWMRLNGTSVPANSTGPTDTPMGDGVPNVCKYAFNLNPNAPDARHLTVGAGGAAGLPGVAVISGILRLEFLRRIGSPGITYTPQFASIPGVWTTVPIVNAATPIDSVWERVVVDDPSPTGTRRFTRVIVVQTP